MKRLRESAKDQNNVTQNAEGLHSAKKFQHELGEKGGRAVPRAIASVVKS